MRPKLENLAFVGSKRSFIGYEMAVPQFEFYWHYHPEYELTYILEGQGRRYVGDSYEVFVAGDLVLLGPHLPHTWASENQHFAGCRAIVVQFSQSWADRLMPEPEFHRSLHLLKNAVSGLHFTEIPQLVPALLQKVSLGVGLQSLLSLLELLDVLAGIPSRVLVSGAYSPASGKLSQSRINTIFQYVQAGFAGKVEVSTAAALVHLSESAFCKFFKRNTGRTFSDYVNELRVSRACTLLLETDLPIHQVATQSGFDNLAYFNRVFLKKKGIQPGKYRRG